MNPRLILIGGLVLVLLSWGLSVSADDNIENAPNVGGPCAYKQYEGRATITGITQRAAPKDDTYDVKFVFYPNQSISESFAQVEGRELTLLTKRGSYPQTTFLQENNIEIGKDFDCILKVIVKGTCTPTIFEFTSFIER